MKRLLTLFSFFTLILVLAGSTAAAQDGDFSAIDDLIIDLMRRYNVPGVGLAVVRDGEVLYTNGYGVRDVSTGVPVTAQTLFSIGSITKSFTALAAMQQVEAGRVDLDAPIVTVLPDLPHPDTRFEQVTLRHLLSHTSGLQVDDGLWTGRQAEDRDALAAAIIARPLTSDPGEAFAYNNVAYAVAGVVLEQATSETWESLIETNIFAPLNMDTAAVSLEAYQAAADYALPHVIDVRLGSQPVALTYDISLIAPAGAIFASAQDMAQYALLQLGDGTIDGVPVVTQAHLDEMHTAEAHDYALGWTNTRYESVDLVWHNGSIDGFYAGMTLVPAEDLGIIVLTNADVFDGAPAFEQAASLSILVDLLGLAPEQSPVDYVQSLSVTSQEDTQARFDAARAFVADPAGYATLAGDYESSLADIRIEVREDRLYAVVNQEGFMIDAELVPFDENRYVGNARGLTGTVFRFEQDEAGTIILYQDDAEIARKAGEGVVLNRLYTDPDGHFTVDIPQALTITPREGFILGTTAEPPATFAFGTRLAGDLDLQANGEAFARLTAPDFAGEPVDVREIPLPNGITWTQYIYAPAADPIWVVLGTRMGDRDYFVTLQASTTTVQAVTGVLNTLLLSFIPTEG